MIEGEFDGNCRAAGMANQIKVLPAKCVDKSRQVDGLRFNGIAIVWFVTETAAT